MNKITIRKNKGCSCNYLMNKPSGDGLFEIEFDVRDTSGKYLRDFTNYADRWCVYLLIADSLVVSKPVLSDVTTFENLKTGLYNLRVCEAGEMNYLKPVYISRDSTRYQIYSTSIFPKKTDKK
ncbi:MAG: hypothetical protein IAF38_16335 [Bacteroidia bacterium]|nr:hypothetical protein [Bacteroidia bacterium]